MLVAYSDDLRHEFGNHNNVQKGYEFSVEDIVKHNVLRECLDVHWT